MQSLQVSEGIFTFMRNFNYRSFVVLYERDVKFRGVFAELTAQALVHYTQQMSTGNASSRVIGAPLMPNPSLPQQAAPLLPKK